MMDFNSRKNSSLQLSNKFLASLTELIGRVFIEKNYFQNASIPMVMVIFLVSDLIYAIVTQIKGHMKMKELLPISNDCRHDDELEIKNVTDEK